MTVRSDGRLPLLVLISGNGSNLQALLDASQGGAIASVVCGVVSNRTDAYGLERAARAGIPTRVLEARGFRTRESYDAALSELIEPFAPEVIALAGFMRILGADFVARYRGRLLNIHPALLPRYRGLHTHRRVLEAGDRVHGASVHFVTEELDAGPVIVQARVPVLRGDDEAALSARVQLAEHKIYPMAMGWFAEGRLGLAGDRVVFDGEPVPGPVVYDLDERSGLTPSPGSPVSRSACSAPNDKES